MSHRTSYFLYFLGVNFCFAIRLAMRSEFSNEAINKSLSSLSISSIALPSNCEPKGKRRINLKDKDISQSQFADAVGVRKLQLTEL